MMILVAAFLVGMGLLVLLSEDGTLEDGAERAWINYLADESRKARKKPRFRYATSPLYKNPALLQQREAKQMMALENRHLHSITDGRCCQ